MKTVMQELLEHCNKLHFLHWFMENKDRLLAKEREQIMNAFVAGSERGTNDIPFNCEQYYSQNYGGNDESH